MNKIFLISYIILSHSIYSYKFLQNRILEEKEETESGGKEKKGIFCKIDEGFICNHPLIFFLILIIAVAAVVICSCLFVRFCYDRYPIFRGWERTVNERIVRDRQNKRKKEKELEKKKKFYLLNIEIQGMKYNKQLSDFGEKCPICLEPYDYNKDVCFTPCRHLFHHLCLKEYVYGINDVKCPLCKYSLFDCIKNKKIDFKKITITDDIKIYDKKEFLGTEDQNIQNNEVANVN